MVGARGTVVWLQYLLLTYEGNIFSALLYPSVWQVRYECGTLQGGAVLACSVLSKRIC